MLIKSSITSLLVGLSMLAHPVLAQVQFLENEGLSPDFVRYEVKAYSIPGNDKTQQWAFEQVRPETFTIKQVSSGRFLDAYEGSGPDDGDFVAVTQTAQNNASQHWILAAVGLNTYTIQQGSTYRYLDAHQNYKNIDRKGHEAVTQTLQSNTTQHWIRTPVGPGTYTLKQVSSGRFLDAYEGKGPDEAPYLAVTRKAQNLANAAAATPTIRITGSNPNSRPWENTLTEPSTPKGPATTILTGANVGYPCQIELEVKSGGSSWDAARIEVAYIKGHSTPIVTTVFTGGGGAPINLVGNQRVQAIPQQVVDACDKTKRAQRVAAAMPVVAPVIAPTATLKAPEYRPDPNNNLIRFSVVGNIMNAKDKTAEVVLDFRLWDGSAWVTLPVDSGHTDLRGNKPQAQHLMKVSSNPQLISESRFAIPIGAFGLSSQQQPYTVGARAALLIEGQEIARSDWSSHISVPVR